MSDTSDNCTQKDINIGIENAHFKNSLGAKGLSFNKYIQTDIKN